MNDALRILVVEDEIVIARSLEATLKRLGFEVTAVCPTGEAALESARRHRPQVVLMDIRLGSAMDGVETATRLRAEAALPVVFLTGHADEATLKRALTAEPYGCLLKPFQESALRSALELAYARNAAQLALQASGDRLASTLRSMAEGVIATNLLGTVTFVNPVAEAITGWSHREAAGRPLREIFRVTLPDGEALGAAGLVLPGNDGTATASSQRTGHDGGNGPAAARAPRTILLTDRAGRTVPIEETTTPIRDAGGSLGGIVIVFHRRGAPDVRSPQWDIAGPSENPSVTRDAAPVLTSPPPPPWPDLSGIVGSISDPLLAVDADWRITWLNGLAAESLGGREEEMTGRVLWDCLPPSAHRLHYHVFSTALARRGAASLEMEHPARGVWFSVQLYPFEGGLLALFRDITAQRREDEERRRMEKLENLGLLARGFAHDFNNLLTVLLGNLSLAEATLAPAPANPKAGITQAGSDFKSGPGRGPDTGIPAAGEALEELRTALRATAQAQNLVQQLLIFARGGAPIRQWTDPGRVVTDWFTEWQGLPDVEYCLTAPVDTWQVEWDRHQMRRVLANLTRNAEQALTPGSLRRITISLRQSSRPWPVSWESPDNFRARPPAALPDGHSAPGAAHPADPFAWAVASHPAPDGKNSSDSWLVLEVADTGSGMDEGVRVHALEPYFTTRDDHNASGLGLTVCHAITKAHGGILKIHSLPGEGARIRAAFPVTELNLSATLSPLPPPAVSSAAPVAVTAVIKDPSDEDSAGPMDWNQTMPPAGVAEAAHSRMEPPRLWNSNPQPLPVVASSPAFRVLVLEDEPLIRQLLQRLLQSMGAEVTPTAEGSETVRAYAAGLSAGTPFDLVILDLSIPGGMGGAQALEQIRSLDPEVVAIVSSGYSDDPVMSRHADYGFRAVLAKPWQPQALRELVRDLVPACRQAGA